MSPDLDLPPLFLSPDALAKALAIHGAFRGEDTFGMRRSVDLAVERLTGSAWTNYDDVYLALYTLSLSGGGKPMHLAPPRRAREPGNPHLPHLGTVLFMLDVELRSEESAYRLLDERAVSVFINFRRAVEGAIPFPVTPLSVGFGCILVEFGVQVPDLPAFDLHAGSGNQAAATHSLIASHLEGERWSRVARRFHVKDVEINGLS